MGLLIVAVIGMGAAIMVLVHQLNDMKLEAFNNSEFLAAPIKYETQQSQKNDSPAITKRMVLNRHVNRICSIASDR